MTHAADNRFASPGFPGSARDEEKAKSREDMMRMEESARAQKAKISVCKVLAEMGVASRAGDVYGSEWDREKFAADFASDANVQIPEVVPPKSVCQG